jgi:serine/threonine protein kinase
MVFEDAGGRSLREWMQTKPRLLDRLNVAIQIASALTQIHQHNVVHRDINSNNVVFNSETKQLQVAQSYMCSHNTSTNSYLLV